MLWYQNYVMAVPRSSSQLFIFCVQFVYKRLVSIFVDPKRSRPDELCRGGRCSIFFWSARLPEDGTPVMEHAAE